MRFLAIIIISTLFTLGFFASCKKVTNKVDSEKPFVLFFADSSGLINQCFDQVNGLNNVPLKSCSNTVTGLDLPLSIKDTISTFLFRKGSSTDTLKITYSKFNFAGNGEYEIRFRVKSIRPSKGFEQYSTKCTPETFTYCNGDQNLFAVIYL